MRFPILLVRKKRKIQKKTTEICLQILLLSLRESQWSKTNDVVKARIGPPDKKVSHWYAPCFVGLGQTTRSEKRPPCVCVREGSSWSAFIYSYVWLGSVTEGKRKKETPKCLLSWIRAPRFGVDDNEITGLTKWPQIQSLFVWESVLGGYRLFVWAYCCCKCQSYRGPRLTCSPRPLVRDHCPSSTSTIASRHQWKRTFCHDSHPATRMTR